MAEKKTKFTMSTSLKQASTIPKSNSVQSSFKEQTVTTSTSSEHSPEVTESYVIIWLDPNLDFSKEKTQELLSQLRSIINTIKTFIDMEQCIKCLQRVKDKQVFLIISDCFAPHITSLEEQFTHLIAIYIFCNQKSKFDEMMKASKKEKRVFTQMKLLCNELKKEVRQLNNDLAPFSIIPPGSTTNTNELDPSFMYFQLLKENLLTIEYDHDMEIQQLVDFCSRRYVENLVETQRISEFKEGYALHTPIWWYTLECFVYHELNKALRTIDIEPLFKLGFFIRDLHEQIKHRHSKLNVAQIPPTVHRGQGMFNKDFEKLQTAEGGLFFFNSFLSTSVKVEVAEYFAGFSLNKPDRKAILFEIELDPTISSVPFTPVKDLSAMPGEEEILFSMSTVFRIGQIKETDDHLWKVNLTLTSDRDPLLRRLTDHIRLSLGSKSGWHRLGQLMIKMAQFDKALEIYKILLKTVDRNDKAENASLHNQLGYIWKQKDKLDEALSHYQQSIQISQTYLSDTDPGLSSVYSNMGGILKKMGYPERALEWYELVLKIDLAAAKPNPLEIAIDHNNIGSVLDDQGKYPEALKSYEQALEIKLSHLPPYHPSLASTYSNIGLIHRKMGDYSTAVSFYEKTLQIQQKSLSSNHPSLVVTHGKLATALEGLHQYGKAIMHAQQAVNIACQAFGSSHPEVVERQKYLEKLQQKL